MRRNSEEHWRNISFINALGFKSQRIFHRITFMWFPSKDGRNVTQQRNKFKDDTLFSFIQTEYGHREFKRTQALFCVISLKEYLKKQDEIIVPCLEMPHLISRNVS